MTNILAVNGEPIVAGGKALKQNYQFINGFSRWYALTIELTVPLNDFSVLAMYQEKNTGTASNLVDYSKGELSFAEIWMKDETATEVVRSGVARQSNGARSYGYSLYTGEGNYIFQDGVTSQTIDDMPYGEATLFGVRKKNDLISCVMRKNVSVTQSPAVVSDVAPIKQVIFNRFGYQETEAIAWNHFSNVCIFDRYVSSREFDWLKNNGVGNDPLSSSGLVARFNFEECVIINRDGTDRPGFTDQSGNGNHAVIIDSSLPAGTVADQVAYVNANHVIKWLY